MQLTKLKTSTTGAKTKIKTLYQILGRHLNTLSRYILICYLKFDGLDIDLGLVPWEIQIDTRPGLFSSSCSSLKVDLAEHHTRKCLLNDLKPDA